MDELMRHLSNIYAMDRPTLAVICVLCAVSAFALRDYLAIPIMAIFAFPVLLLFSVGIQYLFIIGEIYIPNKIDQWLMWTVIASICGNIIGIGVVACLGRLKHGGIRVSPPVNRISATRIRR